MSTKPERFDARLLLTDAMVSAAKRGEVERFSELYERISPAVLMWAQLRMPKWLLSTASPSDLVQEVWVRALVKFHDFDPARAPFRGWIFGFARMVLTELLRQRAKQGREGGGDSSPISNLDNLPEEMTSMVRRVARKSTAEAIANLVRDLDEEDRRMLLLRAFDGCSHEKIAEDMGMTPAAVRKKWQRLRERLEHSGLAEHLLEDGL